MKSAVQKITPCVNLIASKSSWIEDLALQQLIKTSQLPGMQRVAGMPDLHPGRGYPIGAAFFSRDLIYPALVGNDIGCGMALWQTDAKLKKLNHSKLAKQLAHIELPLGDDFSAVIANGKVAKNIVNHDFDHALGTIGGGNHFAEFQAIETVYQAQALAELGLNKNALQLLVHSGSRGLGQAILAEHLTHFNHHGLMSSSQDSLSYLERHNAAVRWAELNRELIAKRFIAAINADGECAIDINHNLVVAKEIAGESGWLHRKGATPSDRGYVVIPGSRGDYTYLVKPLLSNNEYSNGINLFSLAHGAGRKWARGECQGRLSHKYKRDDLFKTALGSQVICGNKTLLYDEAPQAYKPCESVVNDMVNAGLIEVVAKLRPVLTFKTHGNCAG